MHTQEGAARQAGTWQYARSAWLPDAVPKDQQRATSREGGGLSGWVSQDRLLCPPQHTDDFYVHDPSSTRMNLVSAGPALAML